VVEWSWKLAGKDWDNDVRTPSLCDSRLVVTPIDRLLLLLLLCGAAQSLAANGRYWLVGVGDIFYVRVKVSHQLNIN
jgi:hypothetical protein